MHACYADKTKIDQRNQRCRWGAALNWYGIRIACVSFRFWFDLYVYWKFQILIGKKSHVIKYIIKYWLKISDLRVLLIYKYLFIIYFKFMILFWRKKGTLEQWCNINQHAESKKRLMNHLQYSVGFAPGPFS